VLGELEGAAAPSLQSAAGAAPTEESLAPPAADVGLLVDAAEEAVPAGAPAAAPAAPAGDQSRAALYREAQRLDIPGRTKMTKDELAAAIAKA